MRERVEGHERMEGRGLRVERAMFLRAGGAVVLAAGMSGASAVGSVAAAQSVVPPRPAPAPAQAFVFPRVVERTLPNGVRLLVVEDHSVPVIAARVVVGVDELLDPAGKEGVYQVMLGALRDGTTSRSAAQVAEASARIGTAVSPTAFTTTPAAFGPALALMGDMLMHPSFDESSIERRRAAQAATVRNAAQRPSAAPRALFYAALHGRDAAFTRSLFATEAAVSAITRADVAAFYDRYVGPRHTTVIVAGDVTAASAVAEVDKVFGAWTKSAEPGHAAAPTESPARVMSTSSPSNPAPTPTSEAPVGRRPTIRLLDVPGTAAYIYVGGAGPARDARDAFAAEMTGTIAANRFLQALREKRSLMYSGTMGIVWRPLPRAAEFVGTTNVAPVKVDSALTEWLALLKDLGTTSPPTATELENAKRARVGPLPVRIDGPDSVATRLAELVRDNLPADYLQRYARGVEAVTTADVLAAARRYADPARLTIVVSGDRRTIESGLRAISAVEIVDANGRVITP